MQGVLILGSGTTRLRQGKLLRHSLTWRNW